MSAVAIPPAAATSVLELKTVREPAARARFLAAIRELGRDGDAFTLERLQGLMEAEEHFHTLLLYDQIEFLRRPTAPSEAERDFALNVQRICLESANGFQRFLRNRNAWATTREGLETMFRVTGLALNAIHGFVKWGYFLNEPGRSAPWKQLHALYVLAENDGYAQVPFVLHPSQPSFKPSVQSLYLRTLLLDLLNTGNLTRIQIEIADGWFSSWCNDYALDSAYSSRHHPFYVDVSSDAGLRIMRPDSHGESLRYVRVDGLKAQIEEVQTGLRHGRLYAGYGAGAVFPVEQHVALLAIIEQLYHSILSGGESRIEARTPLEDREVDVTLGAERVFRRIIAGPAAEPALPDPAAPDPELERWRVHDLSSHGYGLLVDRAAGERVVLNGLIALRNHETGGWIVGSVVRKLANRVRGEMLVGVEVLSYHPVAVTLAPSPGGEALDALYLPGQDGNGKSDSILVRPEHFAVGNAFVLTAGAAYRVRLNRILKKGADWIKTRFEIEAKS